MFLPGLFPTIGRPRPSYGIFGTTSLLIPGGAVAAIPAGSSVHTADNPRADPIHSGSNGDILTGKPQITKCIIIVVCASVVAGFLLTCLWRFIRHRRRRRRRSNDVEIANVSRHRRRISRRRRLRDPPPPYSPAVIHQPLTMQYLEDGRMATIDGIEDRSINIASDSDLPRAPAPAYKL
ncbi:hypothetical protein TWF481_007413 [Arthrobotrys musiformis]|uniref:Uncharacterized protein n=1 Tax=Arthrobotrys musiformis TaxID=47236 RepID=A0AAV9WD09_9PEZI